MCTVIKEITFSFWFQGNLKTSNSNRRTLLIFQILLLMLLSKETQTVRKPPGWQWPSGHTGLSSTNNNRDKVWILTSSSGRGGCFISRRNDFKSTSNRAGRHIKKQNKTHRYQQDEITSENSRGEKPVRWEAITRITTFNNQRIAVHVWDDI